MENEEQFKEEIRVLMEKKGNVKGEAFKSHQAFIIYKEGENGFKKVQEKLIELGHPIDFENIEIYKMYSAPLALLVILVAKNLFNWDDETIKESGKFNLKNSFILKTFLKYFVSPQSIPRLIPNFWKKEYDFGSIESVQSEIDNQTIVRVRDYDLHPLNCLAFVGVGEEAFKYVLRGKKISVKETKCIHRGDDYHEYIVSWI
jgi:hypothetical protein